MSTPSSGRNDNTQNSELKFWLALLRAPGVGCSRFSTLLEHFPTPQEVFVAAQSNYLRNVLANGNIINDKTLSYLRNPDWDIIENDLLWLSQENNGVLTIQDPAYTQNYCVKSTIPLPFCFTVVIRIYLITPKLPSLAAAIPVVMAQKPHWNLPGI